MYELLFGKLNQDYCKFFYILMIFNLFFILLPSVLAFIYFILKFKVNFILLFNQIFMVFLAFLVYLQSRIFYSMCHMH